MDEDFEEYPKWIGTSPTDPNRGVVVNDEIEEAQAIAEYGLAPPVEEPPVEVQPDPVVDVKKK